MAMRRLPYVALVLAAAWVSALVSGCGERAAALPAGEHAWTVREPAVAGVFYPADSARLRRMVEGFLKEAAPQVPERLRGKRPVALIVPHAGYQYSGATAAWAYKLLEGSPAPRRIILLGPSHYVYLRGRASVSPYAACATPLGQVPVDRGACEALLELPECVSEPAAHVREHSLEVQLPFLLAVWDRPPKIVPLVVGDVRGEALKRLAEGLGRVAGEDALFVASSDFTHYGAAFGFTPFEGLRGRELVQKVRELDQGAISLIERCDGQGLLQYCDRTGATICGRAAIALMLEAISRRGPLESVSLRYVTSADVTGDYSRLVAYHAHVFYRRESGPAP